jgi:hypothetical protein
MEHRTASDQERPPVRAGAAGAAGAGAGACAHAAPGIASAAGNKQGDNNTTLFKSSTLV